MVYIEILDDFHECCGKFLCISDIIGRSYIVFISTTCYIWSTGEIGPIALSVRSSTEPIFLYPLIGSVIEKNRISIVSKNRISYLLSEIEKGNLLVGLCNSIPLYKSRISSDEYKVMKEYALSTNDTALLRAIDSFTYGE